MKKILFINPCLRYDAKRKYVPVGLAYILTAVEKAGIEFELIDMDAYAISVGDLRDRLEKETYNIYALGCIDSSFSLVKEIASVIRESNPKGVIIAGNSASVIFGYPQETIKTIKMTLGLCEQYNISKR